MGYKALHGVTRRYRALHVLKFQLYGLSDGILHVFNTIYENEFQNPQIFQQTISLFPEQSTLAKVIFWLFSN
jgi:hypothetical protein